MGQLPHVLLQRPDLAVHASPLLPVIALLLVGFALVLLVRH
jgi:hypothetical protein